jgi:hypothetical protein
MIAAINSNSSCKRRHHGADHGHAGQDIDFLLQVFFTMLPINFGRPLKSDPIVKNKTIAGTQKKAPAKAGAFDPMNSFGKISTSRRPGRQNCS